MCLEADRGVCMLDRAGVYAGGSKLSNELFLFSRNKMQWEQLDATQVLGFPPIARYSHGMVAVGSNLYVFGGYTSVYPGDTRHCDAGNRLAACQIERRRYSARC
jgi:hypothetical protein